MQKIAHLNLKTNTSDTRALRLRLGAKTRVQSGTR
jgi:hypothetical protein